MSRVKLEEQTHYEFQHIMTVRVTDVNYGNHLGNDALVGFIHQARVALMHTLECRELDLGDQQTGIIMADLVVNFLAEGFLFDEIQIDSHIGDMARKSFRIYHRLSRASHRIALAETGIITFNYAERRPVPIPPIFLERLAQYREATEG